MAANRMGSIAGNFTFQGRLPATDARALMFLLLHPKGGPCSGYILLWQVVQALSPAVRDYPAIRKGAIQFLKPLQIAVGGGRHHIGRLQAFLYFFKVFLVSLREQVLL